ncbi:hypothetical protein, partial [Klebsiella pneumoniae]|uniref:hypothetical protein n=1 Tax=Klebsiella pneumoniae TaxID=573 RepID=UPI003851CC85
KVIIEPCSVREYTIDVTKTKWTQITLGGDHESRIPGCYGVLYKIKVISSKAKKVEVFMSGRGGTVRVPYVIDSKLHVTSTLAPRKFYPIF